MSRKQLLVATHNTGKVREYQQLLRDLPVDLVSLDDLRITHDVDETGTTFHENAWLKARAYCGLGQMMTLSDDSGLEVDALGGEPGVHSARYGGDLCRSDQDRVEFLLQNLEGVHGRAELPVPLCHRHLRSWRFRGVGGRLRGGDDTIRTTGY